MAKRKVEVKVDSYGVYKDWDPKSQDLPTISQFTTRVPAFIGIEFGFVTAIKGAKNQKLTYVIDHPGILDADGHPRPAFEGEVYVKTQDWKFYLGDTIWEPIDDKLGPWHMWLELDGEVIAEKTFEVT